jgi:fatty-acyl-CoA synthase
VVGLPDVQWGEVVCAAVVPVDRQSPPSLEDLRAHCEHTLTPFKRPRRLVVVESIPRTASTNQIQRPLLIERILLTEV